MKTSFLLLATFFFFGYFQVQAQHEHKPEAVSLKKAKEKSLKMHDEYPKVANAQFKCCDNNEKKHAIVDKAWHDLWHNFTVYYHEKGLYFNKKQRLYAHLHFSETGHLDYFGYHFKRKKTEKSDQFVKLFKEYVKTHDFGIAEGVKFSQCGELHLLPREGVREGM
ncbi:MAG: hypothetical protein ACJAWV_001268 [Flammeovirgaceae bacterium]|jgi:hypothetical protein